MITADVLARELGCTLSDLDDLNVMPPLQPEHMIYDLAADRLREAWSESTGIDYTENDLIRATTLEHRVNAIRAEVDFYVLECACGHRLTSNSIVPEAARRRLYKSHALHVATCLMSVEAGE